MDFHQLMISKVFVFSIDHFSDLKKISKIPEVTATSQKYPQDND